MATAPLRITLAGGGTDVPEWYQLNGSRVVYAAIDRCVTVYVGAQHPPLNSASSGPYLDLIRQVARRHTFCEVSIEPVDEAAGLGASSAVLVAARAAMKTCMDEKWDSASVAEWAFSIERERAGQPCGKQDHYSAAYGGVGLLEINRSGDCVVEPVEHARDLLDGALLLVDTRFRRTDHRILRNRANALLTSGRSHYLEFVQSQVDDVLNAIQIGSLKQLGAAFTRHWEQKKKTESVEIADVVDNIIERGVMGGALAGKLVGGGGGGSVVLVCPHGAVEAVANLIGTDLRPLQVSSAGVTVVEQ